MAPRRLYFRTRGGPLHGWGNIFRLGAFASYCRDREESDIHFFVEGPKEVARYLKKRGFKVITLPEDVSLKKESNIFSRQPKADVLFTEMLDCNYDRQSILKAYAERLVVFDDLLDHRYCGDIVVCGQTLPGYGNVAISNPKTKFLLGPDYFLCRPEFKAYLAKKKRYSKRIRYILVSLGGGCYDIGYLKVAYALLSLRDRIKVEFILGYARQDNLKRELSRMLPQAKIRGGVGRLDRLLWNSDLAIVSGGYSKFEAAMTKTPMVVLAVQWHQIPLAEEFSKKVSAPYLGYIGFVSPKKIRESIEALRNVGVRRKQGMRICKAIDGGGMDRVYSKIFS